MTLISTPLISVVIPAFNSEKTIRETIDSVLNQTWKNLELIVINDGSQDSTLDIINSIKDPGLFHSKQVKSKASKVREPSI